MLAYVFWHWPRPEVAPDRYAQNLLAFHRALREAPPGGLAGSRVREIEGAPWLPVAHAVEDWYLVEDFAALGALEEAAVSGRRLAPHDGAARLALGGAGGLYGRLRAGPADAEADRPSWFAKPSGVPYPDFLSRAPAGELWQRRMVLGPAPEFRLSGGPPPPDAVDPVAPGDRLLYAWG